jgi:hypothetical protein
MADELELDLEQLDENINNQNKVEKRITDLSQKVKDTSTERDEANAKAQAEADARLAAEKERDFFKDFSTQSSKYPGAAEHQDKILEKFNAGYSLEDAVVSVLNTEGKLTSQPKTVEREPVAGGSAVNQPSMGGDKEIAQMTQAERREKLLEAQARGDLSIT